MANVPFSTLYDQVIPYLPGAETGLVDAQIRKALREFMRRTTITRETFNFNTVVGADTYQLIPSFGEVSSIIEVRTGPVGGEVSHMPLPVIPEEKRCQRDPGPPIAWHTTALDYLTIYPMPDDLYPFSVIAVVTLAQNSTDYPDYIQRHHAEAVASGVLSLMYSMPGKPWSQPQAAAAAGRMFNGEIRTLRGSLRDGGQPNQSTFRGAYKFGA